MTQCVVKPLGFAPLTRLMRSDIKASSLCSPHQTNSNRGKWLMNFMAKVMFNLDLLGFRVFLFAKA